MKDSNTVVIAVIALIVAVIAIILVVTQSPTGQAISAFESSTGPGGGPKCYWQTQSFRQAGDSVIVGDSCTNTGDNFDPFKKGSISTNTGGYTDHCVDYSYLNEYRCDGTIGKLTYGFCTGGCNFAGSTTNALTSAEEEEEAPKNVCYKKTWVCGTVGAFAAF